jgi:hypothetical protein
MQLHAMQKTKLFIKIFNLRVYSFAKNRVLHDYSSNYQVVSGYSAKQEWLNE